MGGGQIREGSELVPEKPHYSDEYAPSVLRLAIQNPDLVSAQVGGRVCGFSSQRRVYTS